MMKRTYSCLQAILVFILCFVMGIAFAKKDPDESGVGGTGHKQKTIVVDPDMLNDLDMPERVEVPDVLESLDSIDAAAGADSPVDTTDVATPPDTTNK